MKLHTTVGINIPKTTSRGPPTLDVNHENYCFSSYSEKTY